MDLPDQHFLDKLNAQCQRLIEHYDNLADGDPEKDEGYSSFNFTISIRYNQFIYRSSFEVTYDGTLNIQNGCLQVSFGNEGYVSHVDANSLAKGCIVRAGHPYLERGTKDVVTVLLTKFALNMPNKDGEDIYLQDAAKLPGTNTYLSPFNLVRGYDATYVKYGYEGYVADFPTFFPDFVDFQEGPCGLFQMSDTDSVLGELKERERRKFSVYSFAKKISDLLFITWLLSGYRDSGIKGFFKLHHGSYARRILLRSENVKC